jgi:UDP-N-acetylglucosamine--dolichyl-phosphate N-acetylglucosaminephosphotransferase
MPLLEQLIFSLIFMVLVFFFTPFAFSLIATPHVIRKSMEKGLIVKDMYKKDFPKVPSNGGLVLILVAFFSISIVSLFYAKYIPSVNYTLFIIVGLFALFGLLDDIIDIGRPAKLVLLYYCSYALIPFATTTQLVLPLIGVVDLGIVYLQLILPTYVPVTANLVNMHSGFNGLAPGLSLMILSTLILKSLLDGEIFNILFIVSLTGALAGYYLFEKYPARMFWGNVGSLGIGAAIGATIVIQGYIISGFIMLIPHVVNFLLYVYWRLNTNRYPISKFGKVRDDGTLEVPNPLTLKWVLPYYYRVTERQATSAMYALTGIFCVLGFIYPG